MGNLCRIVQLMGGTVRARIGAAANLSGAMTKNITTHDSHRAKSKFIATNCV